MNFACVAGRDGGGAGVVVYAISKGAGMTIERGLAKELGPQDIRVNALCPGMIATTFHDKFAPLCRQGAEEVADALAYLASDESPYITGVNLDIYGGCAYLQAQVY